MRRAPELREGSKEKRSFLFRPPDPVWSSTPHLADVRARLAQFDARVTVWWAANRGRWRLMEWSNAQGFWRPVCFWEGPQGSYREADADAMIAHLGRMAVSSKEALAKIEAHNAKMDAKPNEFREATNAYMRDMAAMRDGRLVVGSDHIRKRNWVFAERGGEHRKMVQKHLIEQWELRNGRKWDYPL